MESRRLSAIKLAVESARGMPGPPARGTGARRNPAYVLGGLPARLQGPPENAADERAAEQHLQHGRDEVRIDHEHDAGGNVCETLLFLPVHEQEHPNAVRHERQHQQRRVEAHSVNATAIAGAPAWWRDSGCAPY